MPTTNKQNREYLQAKINEALMPDEVLASGVPGEEEGIPIILAANAPQILLARIRNVYRLEPDGKTLAAQPKARGEMVKPTSLAIKPGKATLKGSLVEFEEPVEVDTESLPSAAEVAYALRLVPSSDRSEWPKLEAVPVDPGTKMFKRESYGALTKFRVLESPRKTQALAIFVKAGDWSVKAVDATAQRSTSGTPFTVQAIALDGNGRALAAGSAIRLEVDRVRRVTILDRIAAADDAGKLVPTFPPLRFEKTLAEDAILDRPQYATEFGVYVEAYRAAAMALIGSGTGAAPTSTPSSARLTRSRGRACVRRSSRRSWRPSSRATLGCTRGSTRGSSGSRRSAAR